MQSDKTLALTLALSPMRTDPDGTEGHEGNEEQRLSKKVWHTANKPSPFGDGVAESPKVLENGSHSLFPLCPSVKQLYRSV